MLLYISYFAYFVSIFLLFLCLALKNSTYTILFFLVYLKISIILYFNSISLYFTILYFYFLSTLLLNQTLIKNRLQAILLNLLSISSNNNNLDIITYIVRQFTRILLINSILRSYSINITKHLIRSTILSVSLLPSITVLLIILLL